MSERPCDQGHYHEVERQAWENLKDRDGRMQTPDDEELRRARRNVMHLMDWYEALARATDFFIVAVQEHGGQSDEARAEFDRLCGLRLDQR